MKRINLSLFIQGEACKYEDSNDAFARGVIFGASMNKSREEKQ